LSQLVVVIGTGAAGTSPYLLAHDYSSSLLVVSRMGYYLPWALTGGIITAVGNGLVSTFTASTSTAVWIGYQIVMGAGRGCGMQMVTNDIAQVITTSLTF
jgi:hypothetical protein